MVYDLIINPLAGKVKTTKVLERIKEYFVGNNIEFNIYETSHSGHAKELAKELSQNPCTIICIGGDGTLHEIVNGIENFDNVNLAVLPCGTGNDFATNLDLPADEIEALDRIVKATPRFVDYIQVGSVRSINICGMGIDTDVVIAYNKMKLKTRAAYYFCLLKCLVTFKWKDFDLKIDGKDFGNRKAMIVAIANGQDFGGGLKMSPKSKIDDNFLDVVVVNKISKWQFPKALSAFKKGDILKFDYVEHYLCKSVEMKTTANPIINCDGELYDCENFSCNIVSNKLKLLY